MISQALPVSEIIWLMFLSLFMIICGLIGALVRSSYKWGLFVFATVVYFWLFAHLWTTGVRGARVQSRPPGCSQLEPLGRRCGRCLENWGPDEDPWSAPEALECRRGMY